MVKKFFVGGMSCSACSSGIERTVKRLNGVKSANVSLLGESLSVEYDEKTITESEITDSVVSLGYTVGKYDETRLQKTSHADFLKKRFIISVLFLIPLVYLSMGAMFSFPEPTEKICYLLQTLLTLVIIAVNFRFFTNGTKAVIKRVPNMDTLVSLGAAASFLYSFVLVCRFWVGKSFEGALYFESAGMILTLVTLGKWFEARSTQKTGKEIENLLRLMPDEVTREKGGVEEKIPFSAVQSGDILIVKQGQFVPVDGIVVSGTAYLDRSALTGESMPVEVSEKSKVTSADVVKSGFIKLRAEQVGAETTVSRIVKMVKQAGESKAPIQKAVDKIASVFVPTITLIALITFSAWLITTFDFSRAINYAVSVLVISCPCSLGLATPVAVMVATGKGMSLGILYKDAEALQKSEKVNCVLLDKTATLTNGRPTVTDFETLNGADEREVLSLVLSMEEKSEHPIATAIYEYASEKAKKTNITEYNYEIGKGVSAVFDGTEYYLGSEKIMPSSLKKAFRKKADEYSEQGKTTVALARKNELVAYIAVADTLKETSKEAVESLQKDKIRVAMLTGDNEKVASAVAKTVGIKEYFAEALPSDKKQAVERVRQAGGFVAMVGDGINDSPALKSADVGIAMGSGTDIAIDSADIVLVGGDLRQVGTAIELGKATTRKIKQNLFWAFFYNLVAIPVAAGVFWKLGLSLNPMISAGCMSLSSLFVVGNALLLNRFGKGEIKRNQEEGEEKMQKEILIDGMMCEHCVMRVKKALEGVEGVKSVEVKLKKKTAYVETEASDDELKKAVTEAGYEVKAIKTVK